MFDSEDDGDGGDAGDGGYNCPRQPLGGLNKCQKLIQI